MQAFAWSLEADARLLETLEERGLQFPVVLRRLQVLRYAWRFGALLAGLLVEQRILGGFAAGLVMVAGGRADRVNT